MTSSRRLAPFLILLALTAAALFTGAADSPPPGDRRVDAVAISGTPRIPAEIERLKDDEPGPGDPRGMLPLPAHLRYPDARPMPLPDNPEPPADRDRDPARENRILTIDRETGEVWEQDMAVLGDLLGSRYTRAGVGLEQLLEDPESVARNFSAWELVPDPTVGDYPRRVKIFMDFVDIAGDTLDFECSGTLIDPEHVITAAHCIWAHLDLDEGWIINDYAVGVTVVPGYMNGNEPFGTAQWSQMHVWSLWSEDWDHDHDIGIIDLDRPIGALTGWWGYGFSDDCDFYESVNWRHEGWPGESPYTGEQMYRNSGDFDDCDVAGWDYRILWEGASSGGTSGSGAVKTSTGAVYAVLSGSDRETVTQSCRLSSTKYDQLGQIIAEDKPAALDLVAMDANGSPSVESGMRLDSFDFAAFNYSQAAMSGDWDYVMYLSDDAWISTADLAVGAGSFSFSFGSNQGARVYPTPPLIPADTPSGDYFLGVILTYVDADPANNATSGQEATPVTITCPPSDPPTLVGPWNDGVCLPVDLIFDWNPVAGLADYQLQVGTACGDGTILEMQTTQYTWFGLAHNTTYFWRVRAKAQCGSWGTWSPCWSFTTRPDYSVPPTPASPAQGTKCLDVPVTLSWDAYPNVQGYEYRIDPVCGQGAAVPAAGTSAVVTDLAAGVQYFWSVRAQTTCGAWTDWSPCVWLKTAPAFAARPQMLSPEDGSPCVNASAGLAWLPDPEAASYDVQYGTACGEGPVVNTTDTYLIVFGLTDGVTYHWRVRTHHECGLVSAWTPCWSFTSDSEPPSVPANPAADPPPSTWSNDNTVHVTWGPATDNCALPWYSVLFDRSLDTVPDDEVDHEATQTTSPPLEDGVDHWFHLKALDWAGNSSPPVHLGPFMIDTAPPTAPVIGFTTIDAGQTFGVALLTVEWEPSTDAASGLAGYSWWLDIVSSPVGQPDTIVDTTDRSLTFELELEETFWFFVMPLDNAGNAGPGAYAGPFHIDHDWLGVAFQYPAGGEVLQEGDPFTIRWYVYDDGLANVAGGDLAYSVDDGATWVPIAGLGAADLLGRQHAWTVPAAGSDAAMLRLRAVDQFDRTVATRSRRFTMVQVTDVPDTPPAATDSYVLKNNRPNPFNPRTTIEFELPAASGIRLTVFDMTGKLVRRLVDGDRMPAGPHAVDWDGRNEGGRTVAAGVYLYRLEAEGFSETRRMALVK